MHGAKFSLTQRGQDYSITCGYVGGAKTLEGQGVCKFFEIEDATLGESIKTSGLGTPTVLRLKVEGKTYKLPVIESTIVRDDVTSKWTAEFATVDPKTSQPLVPAGTFDVRCFGASGTASGGSVEVTITR